MVDQTEELVREAPDNSDYTPPERIKTSVTWASPDFKVDRWPKETLVVLQLFKSVKQITWHGKGDYFATTLPEGQNRC